MGQNKVVNFPATASTAPLQNVALCGQALQTVMDRPGHLPGITVLYGYSGYGKSTAAAYWANKMRAYYVACKSVWTRKSFLVAILREMGVNANLKHTLADLEDQIAEELVKSGRPLMIDEFDAIVNRGGAEIALDLYEASSGAIMLIGEEYLKDKIQRWERLHGRVLHWAAAQPASFEDARLLQHLYCPDTNIADDLLAKLHDVSRGSVRRIAVNLEHVREQALKHGWTVADLKAWANRPFYTGEPPARRG